MSLELSTASSDCNARCICLSENVGPVQQDNGGRATQNRLEIALGSCNVRGYGIKNPVPTSCPLRRALTHALDASLAPPHQSRSRWFRTKEVLMVSDPLVAHFFASGNRRSSTSPMVSVVVVSTDPEELLESRLASLRSRSDPAGTEYVVTWAGPGRASGELKRRFPHIKLISAPQSTSVAELRIQGIKAAAGDIVLLLQHDDSLDVPLSDFVTADRHADVTERSGSTKWDLAIGPGRERTPGVALNAQGA